MKTYIITEEDIIRLIESFNADSHKYWYEDKVDKWEESLKTREEFAEEWANEEINKLQPVLDSMQQKKNDVIEQILSYYNNVYEGAILTYKNNRFVISGTNEENMQKVEQEIKLMLAFSAKNN